MNFIEKTNIVSFFFLVQLQIEELTRRLKMNDLGIPTNPEDR
jgi:hypothetical protein